MAIELDFPGRRRKSVHGAVDVSVARARRKSRFFPRCRRRMEREFLGVLFIGRFYWQ